jgi:hypothetical protein
MHHIQRRLSEALLIAIREREPRDYRHGALHPRPGIPQLLVSKPQFSGDNSVRVTAVRQEVAGDGQLSVLLPAALPAPWSGGGMGRRRHPSRQQSRTTSPPASQAPSIPGPPSSRSTPVPPISRTSSPGPPNRSSSLSSPSRMSSPRPPAVSSGRPGRPRKAATTTRSSGRPARQGARRVLALVDAWRGRADRAREVAARRLAEARRKGERLLSAALFGGGWRSRARRGARR